MYTEFNKLVIWQKLVFKVIYKLNSRGFSRALQHAAQLGNRTTDPQMGVLLTELQLFDTKSHLTSHNNLLA